MVHPDERSTIQTIYDSAPIPGSHHPLETPSLGPNTSPLKTVAQKATPEPRKQSLSTTSPISANVKRLKTSKGLRSLQALLSRLVRRAKGILQTRHLPWIANRVCQTYIDDDQTDLQAACKTILQMRLELNPRQLHHFLHTPMGDVLMSGLDRFFRPIEPLDSPPPSSSERAKSSSLSPLSFSPATPDHNQQRDRKPWHTALINMASEPGGISLLSVLRHIPKSLHLNSDRVFSAAQKIDCLLQETEQVIEELEMAALQEMNQGAIPTFDTLPDLRQVGPFDITSYCFQLQGQGDSAAMYQAGLVDDPAWCQQRRERCLRIWVYLPRPWPTSSIPVVILSHGLASAPDDLVEYAQHLASHGYAIALPQHPGSDTTYVQQMLAGHASEVFEHTEFIHRPLDISDVLDELERRNRCDYGHRLNLRKVGIVGASFGAYTALVVAGATLELTQLATACHSHPAAPNMSLLLQCRALSLPRPSYSLHDHRIAAVVTLDAVGSQTLDTETLSQIHSPVMMLAGSRDITAPLAVEQLGLFQHLNPAQRYLGIMMGKSHLRNWHKWQTSLELDLQVFPTLTTPQNPLFDTYIQALTLAFFKLYLEKQATAAGYLQAAYGQYLSQPPFNVLFLKSWKANQMIAQTLDRE